MLHGCFKNFAMLKQILFEVLVLAPVKFVTGANKLQAKHSKFVNLKLSQTAVFIIAVVILSKNNQKNFKNMKEKT